jgi:hypothetical protein
MKRIIIGLDRTLEKLATIACGPLTERERPPGLGAKLFVLGLLGALVALGWAANRVR